MVIATVSKVVTHNDDGKKDCNVSATWNTSGTYSCGTASASGKMALTKIARATVCPNLDGYIESSAPIVLNPASSSFKHRLYYSYNGKTGYYPSSTGFFANTGSLNLDESFYEKTPNAIGTGTLTLYTYDNSGNQIGSKTGTITIRCDSNKCKPTITATIVDSNSTTTALTGDSSKLIKGYSNAKITYTITTKNSATLSSKKVNGSTLGTSPYTINKVTTGSFSIVATDSRGFSTTLEKKNTLINYIPLAINFNAFRPTPTGSEIRVNFSGNYFNGTFGSVANTLSLSWKYRVLRTSAWTDGGTFVKDTDYKISGNQFYSGTGSSASDISLGTDLFPYNQPYEIGIFYKDKLVDTYSTKPVPKGEPVLNWEDGLVNANGNLDVNGSIWSSGGITARFKPIYLTAGKNLNDLRNPGMYYCTGNATAEQIENVPIAEAFALFVENHAGCVQTFTTYGRTTMKIYKRNYYNGAWGSWNLVYPQETVLFEGKLYSTQSLSIDLTSYKRLIISFTMYDAANATNTGGSSNVAMLELQDSPKYEYHKANAIVPYIVNDTVQSLTTKFMAVDFTVNPSKTTFTFRAWYEVLQSSSSTGYYVSKIVGVK